MRTRVIKVTGWVLAFGVMAMSGEALAQTDAYAEATGPDLVASLAWDSRYVSEGRDNIDGDSLAGATVELGWGTMTLGLWYADSPGQSYREFNAYVCYHLEWRHFEAYGAYNHLRLPAGNEHDNEVGAGITYTALPLNLSIGLDATWSFEAEGAFIEAYLGGEYRIHERLTLRPSATLGFNAGYVAAGHDGANHGELRLEAAIPIHRHLELMGYLASTWAIDADLDRYPDDASLKDVFYGGIALQFAAN